jgi:hypothetical protein
VTAATGRALPIRVPVTAREAADSWLEALARRNGLSVRALLPALGWPAPGTAGGLIAGVPAPVLRQAERAAGRPPGRLGGAMADRYLPLALVLRGGSRYCPACLDQHGGRWQLAWRMPSGSGPGRAPHRDGRGCR